MNQPDRALACYQRAYKFEPNSYELANNLGNCLYYLRRIDEAIEFFDRAIQIKPDEKQAHWNKSLALLAKGDFANGWALYETRWDLADELVNIKVPFRQPRWTGQDVTGKTVLLIGEQGFGDTLQFCRYAPMVAQRGAKVVIACQRGLENILQSIKGVTKVVAEIDHLVDFDYYCPMMSLPYVFKTSVETIPNDVPYLFADNELQLQWRERLDDENNFRVGVAWAGNPRKHDLKSHFIDRRRSMSVFDLSPVFDLTNIAFYSLQKGEAKQHLAMSPFKNKVVDYTDELKDFADTAAFIMQLDLVISVDTAVVHLAGALGKPVWVMSRFDGCWRWLLDRSDSPWYPTATLFRQSKPGDWRELTNEISVRLGRERDKNVKPLANTNLRGN